MEPQTQEDINVYEKYKQPTIDKWTEWLRNIPNGADPAEKAIWYGSIGDFSRDANVIFKDRITGKLYISPDHFETFLKKYFPNSNSYFYLQFADIKRKMDKEVAAKFLSGMEPVPATSSLSGVEKREPVEIFFTGKSEQDEGGSKRKRKSKSKSKRKSQRKSKSKSKRKSNKKSKRMH